MDSTAETQSERPPCSPARAAFYLHPRRELFEHGLLPIPKLIFTDGIQTLSQIKSALLSSGSGFRVKSETLARVLQIPLDHARLLLETISSVLHNELDPLVAARDAPEMDDVGVNVFELLVFLYVQSYKRLLPKGHKDSPAVADVWPSTSAFDGFLSALSPLQLARNNSRRFMPSQADEEAHQLSYLQKHVGNILSLLLNSVEGEDDESIVLSMDRFEHLGILIYFRGMGMELVPLSQNTPFFANSDPDMPAAPVPVSHILDWFLQCISATLEHIADGSSPKENVSSCFSDQDVSMADVSSSSSKSSSSPRGPSYIEGVSKSSYVKQESELKGTSVKVINCHETVIYILAPLRYATVYGCSDATIVLGAVGKAVRVEHCERVHLITAAKRICIVNCRECVFFLGVNQKPLVVGDNHKLQVAPYNTFYPQLEEHLNRTRIDPNINKWDEPVILGVVDPHDSLSHPAGVADAQAESAILLDPDQYTNFVVPNFMGCEQVGTSKDNPFPLPDVYLASQQKKHKNLEEVKKMLRECQLEESRKRELSNALHTCFKDWLYASGYVRQLYCLQGE